MLTRKNVLDSTLVEKKMSSNLTSARYRTHSTYIYRFSWCRCIGITVIAAALTIALLTLTKDSSANLLAKDLTNVPRFPLKGKGTDTIRPNDNDQSFVKMHSMHTIHLAGKYDKQKSVY